MHVCVCVCECIIYVCLSVCLCVSVSVSPYVCILRQTNRKFLHHVIV